MKITWNNSNNAQFYETISEQTLRELAKSGGVDAGCELDLISKYLEKAKTVLEVGASYGRVIELLFQRGFKEKISAIERSNKFHDVLKSKYADIVDLYHIDIRDFIIPHKFDVILWLWSGISDFQKDEQLLLIEKLFSSLEDQGILVLDTLIHSHPPRNASSLSNGQTYIIKENLVNVYGYMPSPEEIFYHGQKLKVQNIEHLVYETSTGLDRNLFILHK